MKTKSRMDRFKEAANLLNQAETILLTTHERTDGDDLGTVLAFYHEFKRRGIDAYIVIKGGVPHNLKFLPGSQYVTETVPHKKFDLLLVSGCSQKSRIGLEEVTGLGIPTLNIDHHPDNSNFGTINVVDPAKSAVAELAYDFFIANNYPISHEVAVCLLTGIFTDTGSFIHSNTAASTLKASADLMRRGAHTARIASFTYKGKDSKVLKAWSKAFANTYFNPEKQMVYSILSEEDLNELGNPPHAIFEGFVETINKVPEARFALFLKQDGNIIKGSLRSDPHKNINVGEMAKALGGGGHMWASGFSIEGKLEKDSNGQWKVVPTKG